MSISQTSELYDNQHFPTGEIGPGSVEVQRKGYCINGNTIPITAQVMKPVQYCAEGHQRESSNGIALVNSQPIQPRITTAIELLALQVPATEPTISDVSNIKHYYKLQTDSCYSVGYYDQLNGGNPNCVPYRQGTSVQIAAHLQSSPFFEPSTAAGTRPQLPVAMATTPGPIGFLPIENPPPYSKAV